MLVPHFIEIKHASSVFLKKTTDYYYKWNNAVVFSSPCGELMALSDVS